jgi:hypothetical protein
MRLVDLINDPAPMFCRLTSYEPKEGYFWQEFEFIEGGHYVEGDALFRERIKIAMAPKD